MKNANDYAINVNFKTISMLALLAALPNLFGMVNLPAVGGYKIHTFQYVVFIAAAVYGPIGGAIAGSFGSLFSAVLLNNPYIIIGNMILGFMTGFFLKKGLKIIPAVMLAYFIQTPWLFISDVYFVGMPVSLVSKIMISLLLSNILWAALAHKSYKPLKHMLGL